ncbi:MAG: hypothetical protein IJC59_01475, partial [Lachnospiraceae bacterium]|nr:hypothetical protein [Lachnospiraceae bacterium]
VDSALCKYYGQEVTIERHEVRKNNGVLLQGICVLETGRCVAPTIYLNGYLEKYERGSTFSEIIQEIIDCCEKYKIHRDLNMDFFMQYEKVRKKLAYRMIHYERNKELLQTVPHRRFCEFAVVCHCVIMDDEIGSGTILINNSHMESWHITESTLFEDAAKSSIRLQPYRLCKISEIVKEAVEHIAGYKMEEISREYPIDNEEVLEKTVNHMLQELEENSIRMYVLTNEGRYFGASCLYYPNMLECIGNWLKSDYYVLPSSVHEVIILPESDETAKTNYSTMVQEVNALQVDPEEWLSDCAYLYRRSKKELTVL